LYRYASVQFFIQYIIADLWLKYVVPSLKPKRPIPWGIYLTQVALVGVAMGLDIGLSNLALVYVTVSFYTLAKTSSILFLLIFAFALRMEPISARLTGAVMVLALGELLTVHGETQFSAVGFTLCIFASACSGLRWVLSQKVLHGHAQGQERKRGGYGRGTGGVGGGGGGLLRASYGMQSPPVMLRAVMPVMCAVVFLFSCFKERWWATLPGSPWLDDPGDVLVDLGITALGAAMAFVMSMSEFELVKVGAV
jgi:solute carrier family 35 protein C2